jgi:hypothetical protein
MGHRNHKPERGIFKRKAAVADPDVKVLDFSYTSDVLAQLVVDAWASIPLKTKLLDHTDQTAVKAELASRGVFLNHPVVLTEDEYENGWQQEHDDEVVLVLPDEKRKTAPSGSFTSRNGQIADGRYAERYLVLFQTVR